MEAAKFICMFDSSDASQNSSGCKPRQQNRPVAVVAWINGRLKDLPYADRKNFWHVRVRDLVNRQVVAKANFKSSSVCERSNEQRETEEKAEPLNKGEG